MANKHNCNGFTGSADDCTHPSHNRLDFSRFPKYPRAYGMRDIQGRWTSDPDKAVSYDACTDNFSCPIPNHFHD